MEMVARSLRTRGSLYGYKQFTPDKFRATVDFAVKCLEGVDFDTIVFRGFSGAVVAPAVALILNKPWVLIRKPGESAHSGNLIEGELYDNYVIIDDFTDSGATIREIIATVAKCNPPARPVGVVFYYSDRDISTIQGVPVLWPGRKPKRRAAGCDYADCTGSL